MVLTTDLTRAETNLIGTLRVSPSITVIGYRCFYECNLLEQVILPDGIIEIGVESFKGCTGLTKVNISSGTKYIRESAFEGCTELTEITIPASVESIGDYAFAGCTNLKIAFEGNPTIGEHALDGVTMGDLASLDLISKPIKLDYQLGDTLDLSGIEIHATSNSGITLDVTDSVKFNPTGGDVLGTAGNVSVEGSYSDKTVQFTISVVGVLVGLTVTTNPSKMVYIVNETLDLSGIVVEARYAGGFTTNVTALCSYSIHSGTALTTLGANNITVSYSEGTKSYSDGFNVFVYNEATIPTQTGTVIYNTSSQSPTWNNYDVTSATVGGTTSGIDAGFYTATFILNSGYVWSDYTSGSKDVTWEIKPKPISIPTLSDANKTYNTQVQSPTISTYDSNVITVSEDTSGTTVGKYTIVFTLTNTQNYQWDDNTTSQKTSDWNIVAKPVNVPTVASTTITYDTKAHTPNISTYDGNEIVIGGDISKINAGEYTITFDLASSNYIWSDKTTAQKSAKWKIDKADGNVTLSATSVSVDSANKTKQVTVSNNTGTVSVSSSNTSIVTTRLSGNTITITFPDTTSGTANITVSVASSSNYNATTKTITVTGTVIYYTIKFGNQKTQTDSYYNPSVQDFSDRTVKYSETITLPNTAYVEGVIYDVYPPKDQTAFQRTYYLRGSVSEGYTNPLTGNTYNLGDTVSKLTTANGDTVILNIKWTTGTWSVTQNF